MREAQIYSKKQKNTLKTEQNKDPPPRWRDDTLTLNWRGRDPPVDIVVSQLGGSYPLPPPT